MTRPPNHASKEVNRVFGTEPPREPSDGHGPDAEDDGEDHDRWLQDNVPPHHN